MTSTTPAGSRSLRRLGPMAKIRLIAEILAWYPRALRLVRTNDLPRMVAAARDVPEPHPHGEPPELEHEVALQLGVAVQRTLTVVPTDARCLVRSVLLSRMLARRGIDSKLVIGVASDEGFAAHAWVEHDHRPVLPPNMVERLIEL